MSYRIEDAERWMSQALPIQRKAKKYVTFKQLMSAWGLDSKSSVSHRLIHLIAAGKVERFKIGGRFHYHFLDNEKG